MPENPMYVNTVKFPFIYKNYFKQRKNVRLHLKQRDSSIDSLFAKSEVLKSYSYEKGMLHEPLIYVRPYDYEDMEHLNLNSYVEARLRRYEDGREYSKTRTRYCYHS